MPLAADGFSLFALHDAAASRRCRHDAMLLRACRLFSQRVAFAIR